MPHKNLFPMVLVVLLLVIIAGQVFLYRNIMHLNRLTSEGIIQIKEQQKQIVQDAVGALMDDVIGE